MKSLMCMVVEDGSTFCVDIDDHKTIFHLKGMIKQKMYNRFLSQGLTLHIAKKQGNWFKLNDPDVLLLEDGWIATTINDILKNEMDPLYLVNNETFGFPDKDAHGEDDADKNIHILVNLPDDVYGEQYVCKSYRVCTLVDQTKLNAIASRLQIEQWQVGGLELGIREIEPDFPEWYYVRKETLDIIKIFRRDVEKGLSIVFMGTPGVGKSLLVVLFAFYKALCQQKCVVLLRKVAGKGYMMLYLDLKRQRYWQKRLWSFETLDLLKPRDFELCLDGFVYADIHSLFGRLARFRLLAVPNHYEMKSGEYEFRRQYVVPFWSKADLCTIGKRHHWTDAAINERFYYSGGNLRLFLLDKKIAQNAIDGVIAYSPAFLARILSTGYIGVPDYQVDRIRMVSIPARTSTEDEMDHLYKYGSCRRWVCGITSEYVLRRLGNHVKPSYYENLWITGRKIGDDALMQIAFENYVHAMARVGKNVELQVRKLDFGREQHKDAYSTAELKGGSYRNLGMNAAECETIMKQLQGIDYWHPIYRCLVDVNSVAKLTWNAAPDEFGLIKITKSDNLHVDLNVLATYVALIPGYAKFIALVPDKDTADRFRFTPTNHHPSVSFFVAYIATWKTRMSDS